MSCSSSPCLFPLVPILITVMLATESLKDLIWKAPTPRLWFVNKVMGVWGGTTCTLDLIDLDLFPTSISY